MSDSILDCTFGDALAKYGPEKIASETLPFLRDKIRETSVLNRILPPKPVTKFEKNTDDPYPIIREDIGTNKGEVSLWYNRRGEAIFSEPEWPRYECHFNEYNSPQSIKLYGQMMALTVRQLIESNCVRDIQEAMDRDFRRTLDTAAIKSDWIIKPEMGDKPTDLIDRIFKAKKEMVDGTGGYLRPTRIIMPECLSVNMAQLNALGLDLITPTNSRDTEDPVWPVNYIYLVTDPSFLGVNYILLDVEQSLKRNEDVVEWQCWGTAGHAIRDIRSIVRIDLTLA